MSETSTLDLTDLSTNEEEPTIHSEIVEEPVEEPAEPVEEPAEEPVEEPAEPVEEPNSVPSVQEVASNIRDLLTNDNEVESVTESSFTNKFNKLVNIVKESIVKNRRPFKSRLISLSTSSSSDNVKLIELINIIKDWGFNQKQNDRLINIRDNLNLSLENKFLQVIKFVEDYGISEPNRGLLLSLK